MQRTTLDDLAHIQKLWPQFEELVGLRGRRMYALVDEEAGTYTTCTLVRPGESAADFGLQAGVLAGGRYLRGRITGEPPGLYGRIGPAMTELVQQAEVDRSRPLVEFYRRHDEIELWVPVT